MKSDSPDKPPLESPAHLGAPPPDDWAPEARLLTEANRASGFGFSIVGSVGALSIAVLVLLALLVFALDVL